MSLRLHLPLTGDTHNQGLSNVTILGSPASWGNGKIGKCATFSGTQCVYTETTHEFDYLDDFSFAFWLYPVHQGQTSYGDYIFTVGRADYNSYGYGSHLIDETSLRLWFGYNEIHFSIPTKTWSHIAFVRSGSLCTAYLNGKPVTSKEITSNLPTYAESNGLGLGCFHYINGDIYHGFSSLNDFRLYDNAISDREVKELAKGLVVHYPLNRLDVAEYTNLISNSGFNNGTNGWVIENGSGSVVEDDMHGKTLKFKSGSRIYVGVSNVWKSGTTYQVSYYAKSSVSGVTLRPSRSLVNYGETATLTTEWQRCYTTISCTETVAGGTLSFSVNNSSADYYITKIKLETTGVSTAWLPAKSDNPSLYDTVEYDTSGLGNHGTISSNPGYSTDSPRNDGCYQFQKMSTINTTLNTAGFANTYTVAYWAKIDNLSDKMVFGFGDGNNLNLYPTPDKQMFCWNTGDGSGNPFSNGAYAKYNDGQWHHYAITGDGTTSTLYIDGTKIGTAKFRAMSGTKLYINGWGYNANYQWTNGYISDFRLYATALSATDIQALYNAPISITNNGTLMTQGEFKEE